MLYGCDMHFSLIEIEYIKIHRRANRTNGNGVYDDKYEFALKSFSADDVCCDKWKKRICKQWNSSSSESLNFRLAHKSGADLMCHCLVFLSYKYLHKRMPIPWMNERTKSKKLCDFIFLNEIVWPKAKAFYYYSLQLVRNDRSATIFVIAVWPTVQFLIYFQFIAGIEVLVKIRKKRWKG